MSAERLVAHAEVLKLARLLGRDPGSLQYLCGAAPADLARLRQQVTDVLYEGDRQALKRIADAGKVLPVGLVATIGEKVFGATLCARLSGVLEPDRALQVAVRMPPAFLARIAAEMDPRRAIAVISRIPPELAEQAAAVMAAEGETVAMGRFVAHLDDQALRRCIAVVGDAQLLRTAFVLERKDRIDRLVGMLPDERLSKIMETAEREQLWVEALDLIAHIGDGQLDRLMRLSGDRSLPQGLDEAAAEHRAQDVLERAAAHR